MKSFILLTVCYLLTLASCKKSGDSSSITTTIPTLETISGSASTSNSAHSGGIISSDGGSPILSRGVCWAQTGTPTVDSPKTIDGSGSGTFTSTLTNLLPYTQYAVRAYATNSSGIGYGHTTVIVTTQAVTIPTLTTNTPTLINHSSVIMDANITSDGNSPVSIRGICWSTSSNPTIANNIITNGSGTGSFSAILNGLTVNTTYYARGYASNNIGTAYGNEIIFTTRYRIGEFFGGGTVAYIGATQTHGLIAAQYDQTGGARWNNTSDPFADISAYSMSNGVANTNAIIAYIGGTGYAAAICHEYNGGGFNDWYLPSIDELNLLYIQKNSIGNFQNYYYWSSTASSTYNADAWAQNFGSGDQNGDQFKTYMYYVRPIREF